MAAGSATGGGEVSTGGVSPSCCRSPPCCGSQYRWWGRWWSRWSRRRCAMRRPARAVWRWLKGGDGNCSLPCHSADPAFCWPDGAPGRGHARPPLFGASCGARWSCSGTAARRRCPPGEAPRMGRLPCWQTPRTPWGLEVERWHQVARQACSGRMHEASRRQWSWDLKTERGREENHISRWLAQRKTEWSPFFPGHRSLTPFRTAFITSPPPTTLTSPTASHLHMVYVYHHALSTNCWWVLAMLYQISLKVRTTMPNPRDSPTSRFDTRATQHTSTSTPTMATWLRLKKKLHLTSPVTKHL